MRLHCPRGSAGSSRETAPRGGDLVVFDSLENVPAWLERGMARPAARRGLEIPSRGRPARRSG